MHASVFTHKGRGLSGNYQHDNKGKHKRVSISSLQTLRHRTKYQINEFTVTKC